MKTKTKSFGNVNLTITEKEVIGSVTKEEALKAIENKAKEYGSELNIPALYECFFWKSATEIKYRQVSDDEANRVKNYILEVVGKAFEKGVLYHVLSHVVESREGTWSSSFEEAANKYL